jgi:hypothetical protein
VKFDNGRCPVGDERVDENAARINGAITVVLLGLSFVPQLRLLQVYLLVDFAIKVFAGFAYSPNCFLARSLASAFSLPNTPIPAAPKRFAGAVALAFLSGSLISWYAFGSAAGFAFFTGVFLGCALLEATVGFCMGCYVYGLLPALVSKAFVR